MSGAEIIGLVASVIGILKASLEASKKLQDIRELPQAFQQVANKLPLVLEILENVRIGSEHASEPTIKTITPFVNSCEENAQKLKTILEKLEPDEPTWSLQKYLAIIKSWGKKGRVEDLMKEILEDVKVLAADKTMKAATAAQVEDLKIAIDDLAKVEPSAPDEVFERRGGVNVSHGGRGNLYSVVGDKNTNHTGSGNIFRDLQGTSLHFGTSKSPDEVFERRGEINVSHSGTGDLHNVIGDNNNVITGSGNIFRDFTGATTFNLGAAPNPDGK